MIALTVVAVLVIEVVFASLVGRALKRNRRRYPLVSDPARGASETGLTGTPSRPGQATPTQK